MSPSKRKLLSVQDADALIRQHALHWLVCIESYAPDKRRNINQWLLTYADLETCIYTSQKQSIVGFRGTASSKDLYDDAKITLGKVFPRAQAAVAMLKGLMQQNPGHVYVLTGHSLGGRIASVTGQELMLETVTFNQAAPPTYTMTNSVLSTNYHISFDIISAWQTVNTVRICKGYWPLTSWYYNYIPYIWLWNILKGIVPSHSLSNFSNDYTGLEISTEEENKRLSKWFKSLPSSGRRYILMTLFGVNPGQVTNLGIPKII